MQRLVYVWMICAAAGFAIAVVAALALSVTFDHPAEAHPPAAMELRPIPQGAAHSALRDLGHDRLLAG